MTERTPQLRVRAILQGGRVSLSEFVVHGKPSMRLCHQYLLCVGGFVAVSKEGLAAVACSICFNDCFLRRAGWLVTADVVSHV